MRALKSTIPLLAALLIASCENSPSVVSLHPLYDDQTLTLEPAIEGAWKAGNDTWTFERPPDEKRYKLRIVQADSEGKTLVFEAAIAKLAGFLFLDLCSESAGETGAPAHAFFRLQLENDKLELAELNDAWMVKMLATENLPYFETHNKVVITAPTLDLQYFFQHHSQDEGAFAAQGPDVIRLTRIGKTNERA